VNTEPEVAPRRDIAAETMHGDLMAVVLDELRAAPDVWQKLGEVEQDSIIERVKKRTREVIEDCVQMIATQGFTRIRAKVDSIAVKDGIKAVFTLSQHDAARHELIDAQGTTVYIVLADPDAFSGGTQAHQAEPNQGALLLGKLDEIGRRALGDEDGDQDKAA
jgi:hypothetical protein